MQTPDKALIRMLAAIPAATQEAIWLGALITSSLTDEEYADEAQRLIAALEAIRAVTVDSVAAVSVRSKTAQPKALKRVVDPDELRAALLDERKLAIIYIDRKAAQTKRTVWPLDVEDYGPNGAMLCWCEKREDFRHFRFDRVISMQPLADRIPTPRSVMRAYAEVMMREDDGY
jgi:predicted DNA-binding transcriptional regulator YafY